MVGFVSCDYKPETLKECVEYSILAISMICFMFFGPFFIQYVGRLSGHELSIPVCIVLLALTCLFSAIIISWRCKK